MQVIAVKLGTIFSSPSGITETRCAYTVPIMETAVRAVDNYEAKKKFIQLVLASFISRHIPYTWCHPRRSTGHGRALNKNLPSFSFHYDSVFVEIFNLN